MGNTLMLLPLLFIILLFFTNSQKRKMQELQEAKKNNLEVGSIIATYSGIVGEVVKFDDKYIEIKSNGSNFVVLKESIAREIDEEVTLLSTNKQLIVSSNEANESIKLEVMEPSKKSARDEYGF